MAAQQFLAVIGEGGIRRQAWAPTGPTSARPGGFTSNLCVDTEWSGLADRDTGPEPRGYISHRSADRYTGTELRDYFSHGSGGSPTCGLPL